MLKNQKRLEEDQTVKVKIIQAKDQEIKNLKDLINNEENLVKNEQVEEVFEICEASPIPTVIQHLGFFLSSPRKALNSNLGMLKVYLAGETQDQAEEEISWGDIAITTSAKILGRFLSKIF